MKRTFACAVVLVAVGGLLSIPPTPSSANPTVLRAEEFLYQSALDGLAEDGVDPALARELAKREDDFVPKCAICGMIRKALTRYGQSPNAPAPKEGRGLSADLVKRLKSSTDATRRIALRELVQRYIDRGYVRAELTAQERAAMQKELEEMRKAAMPGLREGQNFCPSCDGACRLSPKL